MSAPTLLYISVGLICVYGLFGIGLAVSMYRQVAASRKRGAK